MSYQYPDHGQPQYAAFDPAQPQPPQKPKKSRKWVYGIGALVVIGGIAVATSGGEATDAAQQGFRDGLGVTEAAPVNEAPQPLPEPATEGFPENGTLIVGKDIAPGTYVVTGKGWLGGYWEKLSCLSGEFECVISNGLLAEGEVGYFTVEPTTVAVKVQSAHLELSN